MKNRLALRPKRENNGPHSSSATTALRHVATGAVLSVLVLHPVTMVIYWFELHPTLPGVTTAWEYAAYRLAGAFSPAMLPMTLAFAVLGGLFGTVSALYAAALRRRKGQVVRLEAELQRDVTELLRAGECARLGLKASARWDYRKAAGNRDLELAVARSIAGLLNADGGTLLIGVDDDGSIAGLEKDYHTLRSKGRDEFERFIMDLVAKRLGTDACPLIHVLFHEIDRRDVCRVTVERAHRPVFLSNGERSHFFLRTGSATRELDAQEALHLVQTR